MKVTSEKWQVARRGIGFRGACLEKRPVAASFSEQRDFRWSQGAGARDFTQRRKGSKDAKKRRRVIVKKL